MRILVLTRSPHKTGTTVFLADEFCSGATESGYEIIRIDTAKMQT